MIIFAAPGGIIGARLYYIFFNPDLYRNPDGSWSLAACLSTRNGGLAIYGGIIAGVFIAWLVARYKKIPFPALADVCAFGLLIGKLPTLGKLYERRGLWRPNGPALAHGN